MARTTDAPENTAVANDVEDVRDELLGLLQRAGQAPPPRKAEPQKPQAESRPAEKASSPPKGKAKAEPAASPYADDPNVTCVKCGNTKSWGTASWCPNCGYYPGIAHDGEVPQEESDGLENLTFFDICPPWVLQIAGGLIAIMGLSAVMEHYLDGNLGWLSLASLIQLSFGGVIVLFSHKQAIMMGLRDTDCPSVISMVTYPPAVWMPVLRNLRERAHLLVTLSWGLFACVSALTIYGPIHMDEIKKELAETRKDRKPLMGRILGTMAQVAVATQGPASSNGPSVQLGEEGSLEDAIGGFAGLATEQGGLGEIANGVRTGNIDGAVNQQNSPVGVGGATLTTALPAGGGGPQGGLGANDLALNGVGGNADSIEGAIGNFASAATGQADLSDPEKLKQAMSAGSSAGGSRAGDRLAANGGLGSTSAGDDAIRRSPPITVAPQSGSRNPGQTRASSGGARTTSTNTTESAEPDTRRVQAVVFGYLVGVKGDIRSLLIATSGPDGRPRFAGKVSSDALTTSQWESLTADLPNILTRRPLVACPNSGYWVQPKYLLNVDYERWSSTGPIDAQVESIETR
ncbi:MAG: hypothetical protein KDA75_06315 [Planctomycetaceae bacterium]|nr:hypothetical protein [Planctomycetaceae bacterium]